LKIAREKAGIIKEGRPFITAATQSEVVRLFSKICREKRAPYLRVGKDFRNIRIKERDFHYEGLHRKLWGVTLNLSGPHQVINATTALGAMEVLEELGYPVSTRAMMDGLAGVDWPGRLEMVQSSPRVILDGAHNPAGARVLRESLEKEFRFRHLILLIGILMDKDIAGILRTLSPLAHHIIFTRPRIERAAPAASLQKFLGAKGRKAEIIEDLEEAITRSLSLTGEEDLLCIAGSLYLVGEARAIFSSRGTP
jgi:dihydrofolate synthase/folylpolyglutamate synthase